MAINFKYTREERKLACEINRLDRLVYANKTRLEEYGKERDDLIDKLLNMRKQRLKEQRNKYNKKDKYAKTPNRYEKIEVINNAKS